MLTTSDVAICPPHERLLRAVAALTRLVSTPELIGDEVRLVAGADAVMRALVRHDDWLHPEMAVPHPQYYRQYLLYGDPLERFSLVSFVWGPGQATPVHDHTVWGIIAMLRGAERDQRYRWEGERLVEDGPEHDLLPGHTALVSPRLSDIHRVRNAHADQVSISVHLYGANIGRVQRSVFDPATGTRKPFVSGYSNTLMPNPWALP